MNDDEITEGQRVVITTDRPILGISWRGVHGIVRYTFRRAAGIPDWVTVQVPDDGYALLGFEPDEIEASE